MRCKHFPGKQLYFRLTGYCAGKWNHMWKDKTLFLGDLSFSGHFLEAGCSQQELYPTEINHFTHRSQHCLFEWLIEQRYLCFSIKRLISISSSCNCKGFIFGCTSVSSNIKGAHHWLCDGNPPVTQRANNAESVFMSWCVQSYRIFV